MKMIPMSAAKLSSVKRVKYRTIAERSNATITIQKSVDQRPIHSRNVK